MNDPIKMKDNELAEVKMLKEKFQEKLSQFGLLYIDKMQVEAAVKSLTEKESKLQEEWNNLKKMETELIDKCLITYGEGVLNLADGTFTPDPTPPKNS